MVDADLLSQVHFYLEFLMARGSFEPADFGVNMARNEFIDMIVDDFNTAYRGELSVDELLLRPREAMHFCEEERRNRRWYDVPDDIILRSLMQRRKNPNG